MGPEVIQAISESAFREVHTNEREDLIRDLMARNRDDLTADAIVALLHELDLVGARKVSKVFIRKRAIREIIRRKNELAQQAINERATDSEHLLNRDSTTTARGEWRGPWDARDSIDQAGDDDSSSTEGDRGAGVAPSPPLTQPHAPPPSDSTASAILRRAICALPDAQARAVWHTHIDGASLARTADALGCTRWRARATLDAGMARLVGGDGTGGGVAGETRVGG